MNTILLILLIILDITLLAVLYLRSKPKYENPELLREFSEERRMLKELHAGIKEELVSAQQKSRETLEKVSTLAAEIDMDVKSGGKSLKEELNQVLQELAERVEQPIKQINQKHTAMENLLRRVDKEKKLLIKAISRAEELSKFFNKNIPYEEVLEELTDKKYSDARQLLSQGLPPSEIAKELNMTESEVNILAAMV
ncbi:MAG: hypothetical protein HQK54_05045 [Oligoflexales bacterium]|nr:hypothetical protein [Oligoflexales bacterium]